jgi:hypothetical protein
MTDGASVRLWSGISALAAVATIPIGILITRVWSNSADVAFVAIMVLLVAAISFAGFAATGRWLGALVDDRGKFSLSRLQITLWTVVVTGSVAAAAFANLPVNPDAALEFTIPQELWWVLGISATTLVGAGVVKEVNAGQGRLHTYQPDPTSDAPTGGRRLAPHAALIDLISGEDHGNWQTLDLGKFQALIFSVLVVAIYGTTVFQQFHEVSGQIKTLPVLHEGLIALIGISHAGYLTAKAVPSPSEAAREASNPPATADGPAATGSLERPAPPDQRGDD